MKIANAARPPESDLGPPLAAWLWRIWIGLEDLHTTFSLKPFLCPTHTPRKVRFSLNTLCDGGHFSGSHRSESRFVALRSRSDVPAILSHRLADTGVRQFEVVAAVVVADEAHNRRQEPVGALCSKGSVRYLGKWLPTSLNSRDLAALFSW